MNRADLHLLADNRVLDAAALLDAARWDFAYYCVGYAVECALKACLLHRMGVTGLVFRDKFQAKDCYTHDFEALVDLAGLKGELAARQAASPQFKRCWGVAGAWTVDVRYGTTTQAEARGLFEAVTNDPDGVLPWLQIYW